jgi:hypothetical protein|eukprot:COSAG01_NODE_7788_length_3053_cov_42.917146_3_plen_77_part_00
MMMMLMVTMMIYGLGLPIAQQRTLQTIAAAGPSDTPSPRPSAAPPHPAGVSAAKPEAKPKAKPKAKAKLDEDAPLE